MKMTIMVKWEISKVMNSFFSQREDEMFEPYLPLS